MWLAKPAIRRLCSDKNCQSIRYYRSARRPMYSYDKTVNMWFKSKGTTQTILLPVSYADSNVKKYYAVSIKTVQY